MKKNSLISDGIYPNTIGNMQMHNYLLFKEWLNIWQKVTLIYPFEPIDDKNPMAFKECIQNGTLSLIQLKKQYKFSFPWRYLLGELKYAKQLTSQVEENQFDVVYSQGLTGYKLSKRRLKNTIHITNPYDLEPF
jgi:hypothetical protein